MKQDAVKVTFSARAAPSVNRRLTGRSGRG